MPDIAFSDEAAMMEWLGNLSGDLMERLNEEKQHGNQDIEKLRILIKFESRRRRRHKTGGLSFTIPFNNKRYGQNQGHVLLAEFVLAELKKRGLERGVPNKVAGIQFYGEFV